MYNDNIEIANRAFKTLISEEKKLNHNIFVEKLEKLYELKINDKKNIERKNNIQTLHHYRYQNNENRINNHQVNKFNNILSELPKNPRNNQSLATLIDYKKLRRNMILNKETEERFASIEKEFLAKNRLAKYSLKPKRKILIYWAPGCGKTMSAERVARNVWLPLLKVNFDNLISSYLWETANNLRSIFEVIKQVPCVLLLDECDIIAKSRLAKNDVGEMSRIVNMLLMLLDEDTSDWLIIATTNLEESLDKALYRRFDDVFEIKLPDKIQIHKIIKSTIINIDVCKKIDFAMFSEKLIWLSIADIVSIIENAMKMVILGEEKTICDEHLEKSLSQYNLR